MLTKLLTNIMEWLHQTYQHQTLKSGGTKSGLEQWLFFHKLAIWTAVGDNSCNTFGFNVIHNAIRIAGGETAISCLQRTEVIHGNTMLDIAGHCRASQDIAEHCSTLQDVTCFVPRRLPPSDTQYLLCLLTHSIELCPPAPSQPELLLLDTRNNRASQVKLSTSHQQTNYSNIKNPEEFFVFSTLKRLLLILI